ncbi:MAG: dimethyl sulfoxide reductase anchor subunit [Deltaproteobacteria bacterium]|jgi:anaerobic dimethyl sulfoxide reductase subunit C (anchor subunit)|nr:dimethyl sulfoxide reductase anchor subunit [Deltaproteobacteria bacterium]
MYTQELPLVFFTLLAQLAVGIILVGQWAVPASQRALARRQTPAALVFLAVAALLSIAHTGTPLHGPFTLFNLGSSWLSREIFLLCLTGLCLLLLAFKRRKADAAPQEDACALAVILTGLLLILVMGLVYNQKTIPGWNHLGVFPAFFGAALMLGSLWHGLILARAKAPAEALNGPIICAVIGLGLTAASLPLSMPDMALAGLNPATLIIPYDCLGWSHALHALASGTGVCLLILAALRARPQNAPCPCLALAAFVLLAAGEIFGRWVFYLSYSRLGM